MKRFTVLLLPLALAVLAGCTDRLLPTGAPEGATFTQLPASPVVNSLADDGTGCTDAKCTLRDAIAFASAGATITFSVTGTITLGGSALEIAKDLTIMAPGATNLTVSGNAASRVIRIVSGTVSLVGLTISNGARPSSSSDEIYQGGGILNNGTLTLRNSTVSGNQADWGGGIANNGTLTLQNSTISDNSATEYGGGIDNSGLKVKLVSSTVSGNGANFGGGIYSSGTLTLQNSIVANSTSGGDCVDNGSSNDESGADAGYNLVEDGSCISASTSISGDPRLGALADNGGPTWTHALLVGSPAIDAIPFGSNGCGLSTDQRGVSRPQGGACDIGAFELVLEPEIVPEPQTISFTSTPPALALVGGSYAVSAAATSGLSVSFSSLTESICTVSGSTVSFRALGTCTIAADQAGDSNWQPAPQATQSVTVSQLMLSISGSGSIDRRAGVATVSGTLTCSAPVAVMVNVSLDQQQRQGKTAIIVSGSGSTRVDCSGTTTWTANVTPTSRTFSNGASTASASVVDANPPLQSTQAVLLK